MLSSTCFPTHCCPGTEVTTVLLMISTAELSGLDLLLLRQ